MRADLLMDVAVQQEPQERRFVALIEGDDAGLTAYVERGAQRVFVHTEVGDRFAGRGVASTLIRSALETTRDQGLRIVAVCPFVAAYVQKNHDLADLLDPVPPRTRQTSTPA